ncbi:MAG: leucine--tRNA ligase [bacterium]|nr:leucine--tRNA ligase [bacterium]
MKKYNHKPVEKKWQKFWDAKKLARAKDFDKKPKFYTLVEFPYPSGDGLHVGHVRSYSALDAVARYHRMNGENVLYPIGFDAFGLPTENYAIKNKIHPRIATDRNIKTFTRQLKSLGLSFDWSRAVDTTDPKYYKWTQWIFLQLYKAGMAHRTEIPINWCPKCKTGLANEEVINGRHERCGTEVTKKTLKQWVIMITKYADRLIDDLQLVDYPQRVKTQQINWIGRSEGAIIKFQIANSKFQIDVFTTRADTLFGATYLVVAPEHPLVEEYLKEHGSKAGVWNTKEVKEYVASAMKKTDVSRTAEEKEKTGVELKGLTALHPLTGEKIPIWVADYVMMGYGTGAIMAVPAHDERDFAFAKKYGLPIKLVIKPQDVSLRDNTPPPSAVGHLAIDLEADCWIGEGTMINSGNYNGLPSERGRKQITEDLQTKGLGQKSVSYKLRDWIFSRQHYWGEPIPIIYCDQCGEVSVPETDLPVKLPKVKNYEPTDTGESPLAAIKSFVNTKCPTCRGPAKRETDTMPNWAGSNWYFIRYTDSKNSKEFASRKKMNYFLPVDLYNGGMEHTTLHLLYSRFIYKFLFDQGLVPGPEPYKKRTSHGIILAEDGRKMSKSFGNVINPDVIVGEYGADTLRMYEMFLAPFEQMVPWDARGVIGVKRFLDRVYKLYNSKLKNQNNQEQKIIHKLIKKVSSDILEMKFNTAVAAFMETLNALEQLPEISKQSAETFLILLAPFAPHLAEELWHELGHKKSVHLESWPVVDARLLIEDTVKIPISVNGKMRDIIEVANAASQTKVEELALQSLKVEAYLKGKTIVRTIYVPGKMLNFVVK